MTQRLKRLRAYEVSYVPQGANLKKFLILKEDKAMPKATQQHVEQLIAKMKLKNERKIDVVLKELSPEDADALKAALKVIQAMGDQVDPNLVHELMELIGMAPEDEGEGGGEGAGADDVEKMKKDMAAYKDRAEKAEAEVAKSKATPPPADGGEFPVKKDGSLDEEKIPAETRAMVKALWNAKQAQDERIAKITKQLDDERDARVTKEYVAIASSDFKAIPGKPEELGAVLKEIAVKAPEAYKGLEKVLKAASGLIGKTGITKEIGSSQQRGFSGGASQADGSVAGDAEYIETIVTPAMSQAIAKEKGWGEDQAVTHFITKTAEGRKAYSEYRKEAEAQKRRA